MRKPWLLIFLLLTIAKTHAQDYRISFAAIGDTNVVSNVKVENLTRGNSVFLNSGDTLHLKSSLGIDSQDIEDDRIHLYPNPMKDQTILTFVSTDENSTAFSIVDLSGKTVYRTLLILSPGKHSLRISGIDPGIYLVKVTAKNYSRAIKLISESSSKSQAEIVVISFDESTGNLPLKSAETTTEMLYSDGDLLLFRATAGPYSTVLTDIPTNSKTITFGFSSCNDYDGNHYTTALIGNQTWMAENLKSTHFSDGTEINQVQSNSEWGNLSYSDQAYCYYDNSISNGNTFGALYTWAAAMNGAESSELSPSDVQGACPCGWHLPSDAEWMELEMFLGMTYEEAYGLGWRGTDEGDKLKSASGWFNDGNGTNSSGFSALPGGSRMNDLFSGLGQTTCYWSTTEYFNITYLAFNRSLSYLNSQIGFFSASHYYGYPKNYGLSIRCVKD
jgi:uncharacterized protein (TIGR02145 family)